jgi:hypothetical protein
MPFFTYSKTDHPVALIKGGDYNNKFLYLDMEDGNTNAQGSKRKSNGFIEVDLPDDSMFYPIPDASGKHRQVYYCAGASGSGKSYMARMLAEAYMKMYPKREVYLVSKLQEDDTLDNTKPRPPERISYESFVADPPKVEEFEDSMVIFDDYDTITGKEGEAVQTLIEDIAITGRHTNTTLLCLSHYLSNYKKTRLILNEASHFILYPQATSAHALRYLLQTHVGMEKADIQNLKRLGRWVLIHKNYPQFILSKNKAKILHQD